MLRVVTKVVSAVLALVFAAFALLLVVEIAAAAIDQGPVVLPYDEWYDDARSTSWTDVDVRLLLWGVTALGAALVALALLRRRPDAYAVRPSDGVGDGELDMVVDRRGLERALEGRAQSIDGVGGARARLRRGRGTVAARTTQRELEGLDERVRGAVAQRLELSRLAAPLDVRTNIRRRQQP